MNVFQQAIYLTPLNCQLDDESKGAFFWGYSSYSYSGLGITEYTEFQFRKERSLIWKRNTHGGGDLGTTMSAWRDR